MAYKNHFNDLLLTECAITVQIGDGLNMYRWVSIFIAKKLLPFNSQRQLFFFLAGHNSCFDSRQHMNCAHGP